MYKKLFISIYTKYFTYININKIFILDLHLKMLVLIIQICIKSK